MTAVCLSVCLSICLLSELVTQLWNAASPFNGRWFTRWTWVSRSSSVFFLQLFGNRTSRISCWGISSAGFPSSIPSNNVKAGLSRLWTFTSVTCKILILQKVGLGTNTLTADILVFSSVKRQCEADCSTDWHAVTAQCVTDGQTDVQTARQVR